MRERGAVGEVAVHAALLRQLAWMPDRTIAADDPQLPDLRSDLSDLVASSPDVAELPRRLSP